MKVLFAFISKEMRHVLRDRQVLLILFVMPVIEVLLFGFALSNEVKNTPIAILDYSKDDYSRQLCDRIAASKYFDVRAYPQQINEIEILFESGKIKTALIIPENYSKDLVSHPIPVLQIITDATDLNQANQFVQFLTNIIQQFTNDKLPAFKLPYRIRPVVKMMYNPQLEGATNFVPGVMAMVLLLVCVLMTSVAIVKEKESGSMEVLLVSPINPIIIIISKAIPYFLLSIINLIAIVLLSVYLLHIPFHGSIALLMVVSFIFILTCLFLGIIISHTSSTQQEAMFKSLMGMMLPTILLSGFMFPVENMPLPLRAISNIVPSRWYYTMVKDIMIKGAGLEIIWSELAILCCICLILFIISIKKFNYRLG